MHAGGQYFNEMVTMMTMYPQLYVDISPYTWLEAGNDALLDRFLKSFERPLQTPDPTLEVSP